MGDCKSLNIKNARLVSNKIMKGLVGGLRPGPPVPPLKSGPDGTGSIKIRKTATKYPLIDILILGDDSSERTGEDRPAAGPVSYTHLTLPTILRV